MRLLWRDADCKGDFTHVMLELHAIAGPAFGLSRRVSGETFPVGRAVPAPGWSIDTDIWLSPTHFVLRNSAGAVVLVAEKASKTLVNGKPVDESVALNAGDTISAGTSVFTVSASTVSNDTAPDIAEGKSDEPAAKSTASPYRRIDAGQKAAAFLRGRAADTTLFAIIDAARSPLVRPLLDQAGAPFECLFTLEGMPDDVKGYAPYVVDLRPQSRLLDLLAHHGWSDHWCSYAVSTLSLEQVRVHLKKFLVVKLDDGREVFFRFFDPRVMRVFLSACADDEVERFFGGIDAFFCRGDEDDCLEFKRARPGGQRLLAMQAHAL